MLHYILRFKLKCVKKLTVILTFFVLLVVYSLIHQILSPKSTAPIILWWTPFVLGSDRLIQCHSGVSCTVSNNRSQLRAPNISAIVFYGSNFNKDDLPIPKKTPWAIYHEESPKNLGLFLFKEGQEVFNITSTFSRYSDLPVTLQYLKNIDVLLTHEFYVSIEEKNDKLKTIAPVLYLQTDCDTPINRNEYVQQLSQFISIDSYGACLNNKTLPDNLKISNNVIDYYNYKLMHFISQYKFTIAIENAECYDYISEKIWRSLIVGSVPIYKGAPNIKDWLPNNTSAILIDDFADAQQLAMFIHSINKNDDLYRKFVSHKIDKTISNNLLLSSLNKGNYGIPNNVNNDHAVFLFECLICDTIFKKFENMAHQKKLGNVYDCLYPTNNNWKSHWDNGKYEAHRLRRKTI